MFTTGKWIAETKHSDLGTENPRYFIGIEGGRIIGIINADNGLANAQRIVQCVNSHDELVKALRKYGSHNSSMIMCERIKGDDYPCTCGLEQALANAKS